MSCKGCLASLGIATIVILVAAGVTLINLGRFLDVSVEAQPANALFVMGGEGQRFMRTQHAIALYEANVAPHVVMSGGTLLDAGVACTSTALSVEAARELGLSEDALILSGEAQSTYDEAVNLAALAEERGWESIGLVTDRFHTRRSLATMRELMPGVALYASAPDDPYFRAGRWWSTEQGLVYVVNELLKLGFYWAQYGIRP